MVINETETGIENEKTDISSILKETNKAVIKNVPITNAIPISNLIHHS